MNFYLFKLDTLSVDFQRGKIPDEDVVTFSVMVNQIDRGHGAGQFNGMVSGSGPIPAAAVPPSHTLNMAADWSIGPLQINPGDILTVTYSGTNISDEQLDLSHEDQDKLELRILDLIFASAATAGAGAAASAAAELGELIGAGVGSALGAALGAVADPVGTLLGYKPQGPCNGLVFSDMLAFSGSGIDSLPFAPAFPYPKYSFTHTYSDAATHNSDICGHVAQTDVTFSILKPPYISVTELFTQRFPGHPPSDGVGKAVAPRTDFSIKSILGVLP